ncbi:MAG: hypothetical protein IPM29_06910 [Planctomycetes bacterium]|nr:hypothetical protein [Planctomycetota bacterium]
MADANGKKYTATQGGSGQLLDRVAALRETLVERLGAQLIADPRLAEEITRQIDELLESVVEQRRSEPLPPDKGLAQLAGVGPEAAVELADTRLPPGIVAYDEQVTSERILALGDLYYLYQHERIGVFRVVQKLQDLFRNGSVRLSSGRGAFSLYQFDRREVLRYTRKDRLAAYRRAFGYGAGRPSDGPTNADFHHRFAHFVGQVTLFWRDKRISDVIRERASDPSFGSIAVVRRSGLDLRNNLKNASYGHLNVLRVEVMQLLEEAFEILKSDDVLRLFGADNAWDVVEEILQRYFKKNVVTSPRQRMAITGRDILRWLGQAHILETSRAQFEALLHDIAEDAEEWVTSAESLGVANRHARRSVARIDGTMPPMRRPGIRPAHELEFEL